VVGQLKRIAAGETVQSFYDLKQKIENAKIVDEDFDTTDDMDSQLKEQRMSDKDKAKLVNKFAKKDTSSASINDDEGYDT
jgi:hypothetical protein